MRKAASPIALFLLGLVVLLTSVAAQPNVRKELTRLTEDELLELRRAFEMMQLDEGDCGYQAFSSTHGEPEPIYCPHGVEIFLWWHRAYVISVEQCLQRYAPNIGIPFWDWTSNDAVLNGIPAALANVTYYDPLERREKPNPLYSGLIGFNNTQTTRKPRDPAELAYLRRIMNRSLTYSNFTLFTDRYELAHDLLHVWVGATMQQVFISSYDPLFYFHHTNVDRHLSTWQAMYPESPLSEEIKKQDLPPFSITPEQLINVRYKYSYLYTPPGDIPYLICSSNTIRPARYDVSVVMSGAMMTMHSYLIDIELVKYGDKPEAGEQVVTRAGRVGIFGEGVIHAEHHGRGLERWLSISDAALGFGMQMCPLSGGVLQPQDGPFVQSSTISCPLIPVDSDRPHLLRIDASASEACPESFPLVQLTVMQTTAGSAIPEEISSFYKNVRISWAKIP